MLPAFPLFLNFENRLQKEFKASMRETEEKKNIVEQVSLKKWPNGGSMGNIHQLKDISMRPKLGRGRRTNGTLQMHKNGLRFRYVQKLKIMKNVVNCVTIY
jgi:nucleosome binding factor SPN SPT16 subunit